MPPLLLSRALFWDRIARQVPEFLLQKASEWGVIAGWMRV